VCVWRGEGVSTAVNELEIQSGGKLIQLNTRKLTGGRVFNYVFDSAPASTITLRE
jgi:hypothetical protein